MLRCIYRSFSPKRLVLITVGICLVYITLQRNIVSLSADDIRQLPLSAEHYNKRNKVDEFSQLEYVNFIKVKVCVSSVPIRDLLVSTQSALSRFMYYHRSNTVSQILSNPKELENARQTLQFLNMEEAFINTRATVKPYTGNDVCPDIENLTDLMGPLPQAVLLIQNLQEGEVAASHSEIQPGGHWTPNDCKARYKIAVIIPYRDRQSHLTRLIDFLIPILQRQKLDFRFIVTEQYGNDLFNKGRIMNAAFRFAEQLKVDCVVFHDVDMFPQDDRNPYSCPPQPRHLGAFVSNLGYQLWYNEIVGGVLAMSMEDYRAINGYSNMYWAWGGEDDDMGKRIISLNYTIERPDQETGKYSMLKHAKRKRTAPKLIYKLLEISEKRVPFDGLNETDKWMVKKVTVRPLYYHLFVDVGEVPEEWREKA